MLHELREIFDRSRQKAAEFFDHQSLVGDPDAEEASVLAALPGQMFIEQSQQGDQGHFALAAGQRFSFLRERIWYQIAFGQASSDLLPCVPVDPTGMAPISREPRFGSKDGNYLGRFEKGAHGCAAQLVHTALNRAMLYQDDEGEPLLHPDRIRGAKWTVGIHPSKQEDFDIRLLGQGPPWCQVIFSPRCAGSLGFIQADYMPPPIVVHERDRARLDYLYQPRRDFALPHYCPPQGLEARAEYVAYVRRSMNFFWFEIGG